MNINDDCQVDAQKLIVEAAVEIMCKRYPGWRKQLFRNDIKAVLKRIQPMIEQNAMLTARGEGNEA